MLEQAVILLMSQSLKCLLDGEGMNIREKQILRKELISELVSTHSITLSYAHKLNREILGSIFYKKIMSLQFDTNF